MRPRPSSRRRSVRLAPAVVVLVGLLLAGCGGDGGAATAVADATPGAAVSADPRNDLGGVVKGGTDKDLPPALGGEPAAADVNAVALSALGPAEGRWAGQTGRAYTWGYTELGEGLSTDYCYEGTAGGAGADAADCPFVAALGGRGVEDVFDTIRAVATSSEFPGRTVEATFDARLGYPTSVTITGGEVDGLTISVRHFTLNESLVISDHPDFEACNDYDPAACRRYGAAGQPPPPAFEGDGNGYAQAPDAALLADCDDGDAHACYEVGRRGL